MKNFLNTKNKTDALEYLKRVRQELAKFPPTTQKEYLKKVTIVENWIQGKSIFNEK